MLDLLPGWRCARYHFRMERWRGMQIPRFFDNQIASSSLYTIMLSRTKSMFSTCQRKWPVMIPKFLLLCDCQEQRRRKTNKMKTDSMSSSPTWASNLSTQVTTRRWMVETTGSYLVVSHAVLHRNIISNNSMQVYQVSPELSMHSAP